VGVFRRDRDNFTTFGGDLLFTRYNRLLRRSPYGTNGFIALSRMLAPMQKMDSQTLQYFVDNYSTADNFDRIKFDWNGQHADKFHDNNYDFRMQLCEFLIPQLDSVKLELIRDLYIELSKWAKEAWCVYNKYHLFGQQLLVRGGTKYLMDYIYSSSQGFDTGLASGRLDISKELARQLFDYIDNKAKTSTDEQEKNRLSFFRQRFELLANK